MIKVPLAMGGSWINHSVRSRFCISITNLNPSEITNKICEELKYHLEYNEGFSINSCDEPNYDIVLIDENTFKGDKYAKEFKDYSQLESRIFSKYYLFLENLVANHLK